MQNIRDEVYKLLGEFSNTTASIDTDITIRIDGLINDAYFSLAERDKVSSVYTVNQFPVANMLGETFDYDTHTTTAINYTQTSAYAYHFEVNYDCDVDILEGSSINTMTTLSTLNITGISTFTQYRNFVTAAVSSDYIRLSFYGDNYYTIKNVAFYPYTFGDSTAAIPDFKPYAEYDVPSDYLSLNRVTYRYKDDYGQFTDYRKEGDKWLIPRSYSAEFMFYYWKQVTAVATAVNTFDIQDKTTILIPLYVAGMILIGNGFNVQAGMSLINMYELKKAQIDISHEYGRRNIDNIMGW